MRPNHPYFDVPVPLAIAHRGFSPGGLENSMAAFSAAVDLGFRYLETDARVTKDGVVVAFHDATLDRVTDHNGRIAELAWTDVRAARIGGSEPIPRLEDLLGAWPDLCFNIDVKDEATIVPLARAIDRARAHHRVCVASFSDRRQREVIRRLAAPAASSAGRGTVARVRMAASARFAAGYIRSAMRDVDCLQVPERFGGLELVNRAVVDAIHDAGKQVHVWTVNDEPGMRRLLDLGVDGIMTDRADLLRDVLKARGSWAG